LIWIKSKVVVFTIECMDFGRIAASRAFSPLPRSVVVRWTRPTVLS
jgi:hypothetical protein